jgi:hypothetical protein
MEAIARQMACDDCIRNYCPDDCKHWELKDMFVRIAALNQLIPQIPKPSISTGSNKSNEIQTQTIASLPSAIFFHLLGFFLNDTKTISQTMCVCHAWNKMKSFSSYERIWKDIYVNRWEVESGEDPMIAPVTTTTTMEGSNQPTTPTSWRERFYNRQRVENKWITMDYKRFAHRIDEGGLTKRLICIAGNSKSIAFGFKNGDIVFRGIPDYDRVLHRYSTFPLKKSVMDDGNASHESSENNAISTTPQKFILAACESFIAYHLHVFCINVSRPHHIDVLGVFRTNTLHSDPLIFRTSSPDSTYRLDVGDSGYILSLRMDTGAGVKKYLHVTSIIDRKEHQIPVDTFHYSINWIAMQVLAFEYHRMDASKSSICIYDIKSGQCIKKHAMGTFPWFKGYMCMAPTYTNDRLVLHATEPNQLCVVEGFNGQTPSTTQLRQLSLIQRYSYRKIWSSKHRLISVFTEKTYFHTLTSRDLMCHEHSIPFLAGAQSTLEYIINWRYVGFVYQEPGSNCFCFATYDFGV